MNEGQLVRYKHNMYWIYEVKGDKVVLVPEDAMDFEDGTIQLGKAFQVDKDKLEVP